MYVLSNDSKTCLEHLVTAVVAAAMRGGSKFSLCDLVWEAFSQLAVQDVEGLIIVGALFLLDGGRRKEGNKKEKRKEKNHHGEGVMQILNAVLRQFTYRNLFK
jgi:hypothetical protein